MMSDFEAKRNPFPRRSQGFNLWSEMFPADDIASPGGGWMAPHNLRVDQVNRGCDVRWLCFCFGVYGGILP